MTVLALADLSPIIDQIADGAYLRDIAKQTGIDKRRLSEQLRKHPDYPAAKQAAIEQQIEDAQLALELARETADIARAREMFRAAAWRAEHEWPERWGGVKQQGSQPLVVVLAQQSPDGAVRELPVAGVVLEPK